MKKALIVGAIALASAVGAGIGVGIHEKPEPPQARTQSAVFTYLCPDGRTLAIDQTGCP